MDWKKFSILSWKRKGPITQTVCDDDRPLDPPFSLTGFIR